ncbi:MAG: IclR family transcriptional regulator [Hyphomicrobiaceae bacterium]|nr:IclR family transcriptional regulator [Hyphomicrobiaceae bacterium]
MPKARRTPKVQKPEAVAPIDLNFADMEAGDRLSALEKALLVLEAIVNRPTPVGLPDLTAELGLPRQTIHRVLQQLSETGLLVRDPSRDRYAVGARLSRLSLAALLTRNQGAPVRSVLKATVAKVQETCNIGVLDGLEFVYLDRIEAEWSLRVHLTAGSRVPAYCTSGGKVLLAWLDRDLREALIRSAALQPYTAKTIATPTALSAELDRIREAGYAINDEEYTIGIVGAAVPVLDAAGRALGAVALHGPSPRLSPERARGQVPALQMAARQLAGLWRFGSAPADDIGTPQRRGRPAGG